MSKNAKPVVQAPARKAPSQEIVTPVSARALFWRPRFLSGSAFVHHLPFLFWVVDMLQPRAAVVLGVGDGAAYFGLCQAMDKQGPEARCHGIDPRPEAEGGPTREVRAYNSAQYADFSRLETTDPRDLVHRFEDGSVDLLLLDMDLDAGLIQSLAHDWPRKLSARAVILLHDTETRFGAGPGLGLVQDLTRSCPVVRFEAGAGLAAVLYGEDRLDRLARLSELGLGATGYAEVHHVFARLGAANQHEWAARTEAARAAAAVGQAQAAEAALTGVRDLLATREASLDQRRKAEDSRADQLAAVQARLFEVQTAHDARAAEVAAHARALAEAEAHALREAAGREAALIRERDRADAANARAATAEAERAAALTTLEAERTRAARAAEAAASQLAVKERALSLTIERLEAAQTAAEAAARMAAQTEARARAAVEAALIEAAPESDPAAETRHFAEIRALTLRLEAAQQEVLTLQRDLRGKTDQSSRLRDLEAELQASRAYVAELLASTSWRITAPMRKFTLALRRRG